MTIKKVLSVLYCYWLIIKDITKGINIDIKLCSVANQKIITYESKKENLSEILLIYYTDCTSNVTEKIDHVNLKSCKFLQSFFTIIKSTLHV